MSFNIADLDVFLNESVANSRGKLCVLLFVTHKVSRTPFPYTLKPLLTEGGGQIKGLTGSSIQEILLGLGHTVPIDFLGEAGRTSRGSVKRAQNYLDWLNGALSADSSSVGPIMQIEAKIAKNIAEIFARKEQKIWVPTDEEDYVGPHFAVKNNKISIKVEDNSCIQEDQYVTSGVLAELKKIALSTKEHFASAHNAYHALRRNIDIYCDSISYDLTEINIFVVYSLGLQLDIQLSAVESENGEDPPLSVERRAILNSLLVMHGTFIGSTDLGKKLLDATSHYNIDNVDFRNLNKSNMVLIDLAKSDQLLEDSAASFVQQAVSSASKGTHPKKTGVFALVTSRNFWATIVTTIVGGLASDGVKASAVGHQLSSATAIFVDKAYQFVSAHTAEFIALASSAPDYFQWLIRAIEWLK